MTDYDTMAFAGHDLDAKLFGVFQVSILHNIVHLLFGGVAMARTARTATAFLVGGGVTYLVRLRQRRQLRAGEHRR
jgi:hypothetical protein